MKHLVFYIFLLGSCSAQELIYNNGIYQEKPINSKLNNIYTLDNLTFKSNMSFIYDYYFTDKLGAKSKFLKTDSIGNWVNSINLTPLENPSGDYIDKVVLKVNDQIKESFKHNPDIVQTMICYNYLDKDNQNGAYSLSYGEEISGLIDNKRNIWLHPPTAYGFKILALNPYPFYNLNETIKQWSWSSNVDKFFLDQKWVVSNEKINVRYEYKRMKDELVKTPFGKIQCKVVQAAGTSEFGTSIMKTSLKSYYHAKYGFIKLQYNNIDGSSLTLNLVNVNNETNKIHTTNGDILATYSQNCCKEYFSETLTLYKDSVFKYRFQDKTIIDQHEGKWRFRKDSLILYDFANFGEMKILDGQEIVSSSVKDTIEIGFFDSITKEPLLPILYINGKCVKLWPNEGSKYFLPKQLIKTIGTRSGKYLVKNPNANKFVIYYRPINIYSEFAKLLNISKCFIKGNSLIRIDCEGLIDKGYILDRKN